MNVRDVALGIAEAALLFGCSVYLGVFWGLHFFWYPGWERLTLDSFRPQFFGPIDAATRFFTVLVPIMYVGNLAMLAIEWRTRYRWFHLAVFVLLSASLYVGQRLVFPVNAVLRAPGLTQDVLTSELMRWMRLNDIRTTFITAAWAVLVAYLLQKQFRARTAVS